MAKGNRQSKGNPNLKAGPGRPKGSVSGVIRGTVTRCADFMEREGWARLESIARDGKDQDSISAIKLLSSYGYGQPQARVDMTSDGRPLGFADYMARAQEPLGGEGADTP